MDEQMDGQSTGQIIRWMNGYTDRQMVGLVDRPIGEGQLFK